MLHFTSEDTDFHLVDETSMRQWLQTCASSEERFLGTLTYVFCSDDYLLEKNQSYLDHDTFTDIITFDYCEGDVLNGDILISIERVKENAKERGLEMLTELHRVMAHGMLHLCGYGDKTVAEAEKMREKEEEWMARWKSV